MGLEEEKQMGSRYNDRRSPQMRWECSRWDRSLAALLPSKRSLFNDKCLRKSLPVLLGQLSEATKYHPNATILLSHRAISI